MANQPILLILAHGIFGWGTADGQQNQMKAYFFGVKKFLADEYGTRLTIETPTVPASDSVEKRGAVLKQAIETALQAWPPDTRAHIIAHSMGGLDSRWALAEGGMADHVASLTTIATPHRGTTLGKLAYDFRGIIRQVVKGIDSVADFKADFLASIAKHGFRTQDDPENDPLAFFHLLLNNVVEHSTPEEMERGLHALTFESCDTFNQRLAATERAILERTDRPVTYAAYGGTIGDDHVPPLKFSSDLMQVLGTDKEQQTGNDGAVSVWSAHFPWDDDGTFYRHTYPFDHFRQINWRIPDRRPQATMEQALQAMYRDIMQHILTLEHAQAEPV